MKITARSATSSSYIFLVLIFILPGPGLNAQLKLGAKAPKGALIVFDGSRKALDTNWEYWEGPRFAAEYPIKWKIIDDPVDEGSCMSSNDPSALGGKYGTADIVTKK